MFRTRICSHYELIYKVTFSGCFAMIHAFGISLDLTDNVKLRMVALWSYKTQFRFWILWPEASEPQAQMFEEFVNFGDVQRVVGRVGGRSLAAMWSWRLQLPELYGRPLCPRRPQIAANTGWFLRLGWYASSSPGLRLRASTSQAPLAAHVTCQTIFRNPFNRLPILLLFSLCFEAMWWSESEI